MNKEKLLQKLDEAIAFEEKLIPLLGRHIIASLSFSQLKKEDHERITTYFQDRAVVQTGHVELLRELREDVLKGTKDVY